MLFVEPGLESRGELMAEGYQSRVISVIPHVCGLPVTDFMTPAGEKLWSRGQPAVDDMRWVRSGV